MPGVEKVLPIDWVAQQNNYYCGPAVAHMFLKYFDVNVSQDSLWKDIKDNTQGTRPPGAPVGDPNFDTQVCFNCDGLTPPVWTCWSTTPEALQLTLQNRKPRATTEVRYPLTADSGIQQLIQSIDHPAGVPAIATETSMSHWVVVNGYLRDDASSKEFPPQQVGGYLLNALYVVDPDGVAGADRFGFKTVNAWRADFGAIGCDANPHSNGYPIVVAVAPVAKRLSGVLLATLAFSMFALFWVWSSRRDGGLPRDRLA
jgi:hypothetical protein